MSELPQVGISMREWWVLMGLTTEAQLKSLPVAHMAICLDVFYDAEIYLCSQGVLTRAHWPNPASLKIMPGMTKERLIEETKAFLATMLLEGHDD